MAETFVWDLGFDFAAIQGSNTESYLPSGFVTLSGGKPAAPRIPRNELIRFNVYNLSSGATLEGYSISGIDITFTNALKGQEGNPCPFDNLTPVVYGDGFARIKRDSLGRAQGWGTSSMFGHNLPLWDGILGVDLPVKKDGKFLMTVALIVQGANVLPRTFVVDPEMIIGGAG